MSKRLQHRWRILPPRVSTVLCGVDGLYSLIDCMRSTFPTPEEGVDEHSVLNQDQFGRWCWSIMTNKSVGPEINDLGLFDLTLGRPCNWVVDSWAKLTGLGSEPCRSKEGCQLVQKCKRAYVGCESVDWSSSWKWTGKWRWKGCWCNTHWRTILWR